MSTAGRPRAPTGRPGVARPRSAGPGDLVLVAAGGAVGALARVALARAAPAASDAYPWTTFLVNVGGAFALGLVLTLLLRRLHAEQGLRLFLGTGALGAFTTYSTFADGVSVRLLDGHPGLAVAYAVASVATGLLAAAAGVALGRASPPRPGGPATTRAVR